MILAFSMPQVTMTGGTGASSARPSIYLVSRRLSVLYENVTYGSSASDLIYSTESL